MAEVILGSTRRQCRARWSTSETARVDEAVPPFEPHPWLKGAHVQTIVARFWPWPRHRLPSTYAEVDLGDGDRTSVLESIPEGWSPGDPVGDPGPRPRGRRPLALRRPGRQAAGRTGGPGGPDELARGGAGVRHGPVVLPQRQVRGSPGRRRLARRPGSRLADRAGGFLARSQPRPEAGGRGGRPAGRRASTAWSPPTHRSTFTPAAG